MCRNIARHYFRDTFPIMILPSIPYMAVLFSTDFEGRWLWWGLLSLPRLFCRGWRLKQYFDGMEMNLMVSVSSLHLTRLILMIALSAHWIGSLYFLSARIQPVATPTWLDSLASIFPAFRPDSISLPEKYALCIYRGIDGLISTGYFPMVPGNTLEMFLSLSVQYMSVWMAANILGSLFHYLLSSTKDALKENHVKKMEDLLKIMDQRRLPIASRKRLVEYFEFQYKKAVQP